MNKEYYVMSARASQYEGPESVAIGEEYIAVEEEVDLLPCEALADPGCELIVAETAAAAGTIYAETFGLQSLAIVFEFERSYL